MKFPAYWSRATAQETDADGKPVAFSCWRSSDESADDAHSKALAVAKRVLKQLLDGRPPERYAYGQVPMREEVMQQFTNDRGELIAAVTTNAYGSLVLNTAGVMFIDIDFPPIGPGEQLRYFFARWFTRTAQSPEARRETDVVHGFERFLRDHPAWSARLYRTCAGMRVLVTHDLFDPADDSTRAILETVGADPMYMRLCRGQRSFRARLTPKPWRCGHTKNAVRWPYESETAEQAYEAWRAKYIEAQSSYATCRLVQTLGNGAVHPDAQQVVAVHDKVTRTAEPLALA